jgi:hypothetical protein
VHRFVAALLLNLWLLIAVATAAGLQDTSGITSHIWAQVLAWAGGTALWIAVAFLSWLVRGRQDRPQPSAELPATRRGGR